MSSIEAYTTRGERLRKLFHGRCRQLLIVNYRVRQNRPAPPELQEQWRRAIHAYSRARTAWCKFRGLEQEHAGH